MGEAASPVCFELAKRLNSAQEMTALLDESDTSGSKLKKVKKFNPRQIAQEIANSLGKVEGIARVEVAGGGYLNAYFDREAFWASAQAEQSGEWRVASGETEKRQRRDAESTEGAREGQKTGKKEGQGQGSGDHANTNPNKAGHNRVARNT